MKKRVFLLPMLLLALSVSAGKGKADASAGKAPDQSEMATEIPAMTDTDVAVTDSPENKLEQESGKSGRNPAEIVTYEEFQNLKYEVQTLKSQFDDGSDRESKGGFGFGGMLLSFLFGAAGGFVAFYGMKLASKPEAKFDGEDDADRRAAQTAQNRQANQPRQQQANQPRQQQANQRQQQANQPRQQQANQPRQQPVRKDVDITKPTAEERTVEIVEKPKPVAPPPPPADIRRTAFGSIIMMSADQLIVKDSNLRDSSSGAPFRFDINETRNTASYTFTSDALENLLSDLSTYEPFIEPFDFNPSARNVKVKQPGTLRHMNGYWQVDKRIIISLS